jgi:hypothetical protein
MSEIPKLDWQTQAFPEHRLASLVVDKSLAILAKLFGVWEADIDANHPDIPDVTTYDGLFRRVQEVITDQITSLMAPSTDTVNLYSDRTEVHKRLLELDMIDAQQATLHYAQELWFHAACKNDPQASDLLADWEPERIWTFLDLPEALKHEGTIRDWAQAESSPQPNEHSTLAAARARLIGIPRRSVLPSQARRHPFAEPGWFVRRATAATIGSRVNRRKRAKGRAIAGSADVGGTEAGSAKPSGEAEAHHEDPAEHQEDEDGGSASEPEPSRLGDDPLDPEPNFLRHPNQWKLWLMRQECRRAERRVEPRGLGKAPPVQGKSQPIKHFKGGDGDLNRFLRALKAHFRLARIEDDMDHILTAGMLLEDRAANWFGTYMCKVDSAEARRVHGRDAELDPVFRRWDKFEQSLRDSFGGRVDRDAAVMEWNRLRQKGSIDEFLDDINRLMRITGYQEEVVKDKLRTGLTKDLAKEWSRVYPKPVTVDAQIALLREMGHTAEDHERLENRRKDKQRDSDTSHHRSNRHPGHDKSRKGETSDWKEESAKSTPRRDEAVKGISQEILSQRKKDGDCLRCGRSGHRWSECWAKEPNTEKRKEPSSESGSSASKRLKTSAAAAARAAREDWESDDAGRIMEIPEEDRDVTGRDIQPP